MEFCSQFPSSFSLKQSDELGGMDLRTEKENLKFLLRRKEVKKKGFKNAQKTDNAE